MKKKHLFCNLITLWTLLVGRKNFTHSTYDGKTIWWTFSVNNWVFENCYTIWSVQQCHLHLFSGTYIMVIAYSLRWCISLKLFCFWIILFNRILLNNCAFILLALNSVFLSLNKLNNVSFYKLWDIRKNCLYAHKCRVMTMLLEFH